MIGGKEVMVMTIHDNETLAQRLKGVKTLLSIISEAPQGFKNFEWSMVVLADALDECIRFVDPEDKEDSNE